MSEINGQIMMADAVSDETESTEYQAFVDKFKRKKTTDDCYTPPEVMDAVNAWVVKEYSLDAARFVRPFWPDGDYEQFEYPADCVVVDNPPFSLLSQIMGFYNKRGIKYFLFAPGLTNVGRAVRQNACAICTGAKIIFENGASINIGFVTNLEDGIILRSAPELTQAVNAASERAHANKAKHLDKYAYPDEVITSAKVNWYSQHGTEYRLRRDECVYISKLDAMGGKKIFGGGLLLNERAAAERAAAERAAAERAAAERIAAERTAAIKWQLSEREKRLQCDISPGRV